jgi:hypothetical protein
VIDPLEKFGGGSWWEFVVGPAAGAEVEELEYEVIHAWCCSVLKCGIDRSEYFDGLLQQRYLVLQCERRKLGFIKTRRRRECAVV